MASYIDLNADRGTTFNTNVTLADTNGNPINLSNIVINAQIKKSFITQNVAATFTTSIINSANGVIGLSLPYQVTSNLWPYRYVYDVVIRNTTTNIASRVLEGTIYINPGVSGTP